jgi:hypothetical protein
MDNDWLYSKERLEFREQCLNLLLHNFGSQLDDTGEPKYSSKSIYACAHDWVSQGHPITAGIINYYLTHYV